MTLIWKKCFEIWTLRCNMKNTWRKSHCSNLPTCFSFRKHNSDNNWKKINKFHCWPLGYSIVHFPVSISSPSIVFEFPSHSPHTKITWTTISLTLNGISKSHKENFLFSLLSWNKFWLLLSNNTYEK